jgi:hypothetical protein
MKPRLLISSTDRVTWHNDTMRRMLSDYFEIHDYEPAQNYHATDYTLIAGAGKNNSWVDDLMQQGSKLIYDCLWEYHMADITQQAVIGTLPETLSYLSAGYPYPGLVNRCNYFFWINEYVAMTDAGFDQYVPNKNIKYRSLLPIRQTKPHRKQLLQKLEPYLSQILYSQVDQGRFLPNDQSETLGSFQRFFRPEWYDSTAFSIVSETLTWLLDPRTSITYNLHVTEKSFKPIAFYHPFVTWGQVGTLNRLHELGFETFENLFDETYDQEHNQHRRLDIIIKNIANFDQWQYDQITQEKIAHNHNWFFDVNKVNQMFLQGVVEPIMEYVETR